MDFVNPQLSTSTAIKHDRRRYPRRTVQVQVELRAEGSDVPLRMETTDLSRGGCYIQLMIPLPVDGRVQIKLWLDGKPIVIRGRIVTRHPQFGNGIMFMDYEGQAEVLLHQYLDAIVS
jgi:PilZ domain-containing protein